VSAGTDAITLELYFEVHECISKHVALRFPCNLLQIYLLLLWLYSQQYVPMLSTYPGPQKPVRVPSIELLNNNDSTHNVQFGINNWCNQRLILGWIIVEGGL